MDSCFSSLCMLPETQNYVGYSSSLFLMRKIDTRGVQGYGQGYKKHHPGKSGGALGACPVHLTKITKDL